MAAPGTDRGWLGFRFELVRDGAGLKVLDLVPGASAARGGLRRGDVVTAMNGVEFVFESRHDVGDGLAWIRAGDTVSLTVERGGATRQIDVVADAIPQGLLEARAAHSQETHRGRGNLSKIEAVQRLEELLRDEPLVLRVTRDAAGGFAVEPRKPLAVASDTLVEVLFLDRVEALRSLEAGQSREVTLRLEGDRRSNRRFVLDAD